MSQWRIHPEGIHEILQKVSVAQEDLASAVTDERISAISGGFTWGSWVTNSARLAVEALLDRHRDDMKRIYNSVLAGYVGTANAVIAYQNGQEEMAWVFQHEMVEAAQDGDFSVFREHGYIDLGEGDGS